MHVIPVINVSTFEEALSRAKLASSFSKWVHIDVSDGKYTKHLSWGSPEEFKKLLSSDNALKNMVFEIHLMIQNPEAQLEDWLKAGARRFVIQEDAVVDLGYVKILAKRYDAIILLSVDPASKKVTNKTNLFENFQVLAVPPGPAGQPFNSLALDKIKFLRASFPNAKIEVDGGVNLETAKLVKEAGADIVVSASYIFDSPDPGKAYEELSAI